MVARDLHAVNRALDRVRRRGKMPLVGGGLAELGDIGAEAAAQARAAPEAFVAAGLGAFPVLIAFSASGAAPLGVLLCGGLALASFVGTLAHVVERRAKPAASAGEAFARLRRRARVLAYALATSVASLVGAVSTGGVGCLLGGVGAATAGAPEHVVVALAAGAATIATLAGLALTWPDVGPLLVLGPATALADETTGPREFHDRLEALGRPRLAVLAAIALTPLAGAAAAAAPAFPGFPGAGPERLILLAAALPSIAALAALVSSAAHATAALSRSES